MEAQRSYRLWRRSAYTDCGGAALIQTVEAQCSYRLWRRACADIFVQILHFDDDRLQTHTDHIQRPDHHHRTHLFSFSSYQKKILKKLIELCFRFLITTVWSSRIVRWVFPVTGPAFFVCMMEKKKPSLSGFFFFWTLLTFFPPATRPAPCTVASVFSERSNARFVLWETRSVFAASRTEKKSLWWKIGLVWLICWKYKENTLELISESRPE